MAGFPLGRNDRGGGGEIVSTQLGCVLALSPSISKETMIPCLLLCSHSVLSPSTTTPVKFAGHHPLIPVQSVKQNCKENEILLVADHSLTQALFVEQVAWLETSGRIQASPVDV